MGNHALNRFSIQGSGDTSANILAAGQCMSFDDLGYEDDGTELPHHDGVYLDVEEWVPDDVIVHPYLRDAVSLYRSTMDPLELLCESIDDVLDTTYEFDADGNITDEDEHTSPNDGWDFDGDAESRYLAENEIIFEMIENPDSDDAPPEAEQYAAETLQFGRSHYRREYMADLSRDAWDHIWSRRCFQKNQQSRRGNGRTAQVPWKVHAGRRNDQRRSLRRTTTLEDYVTIWEGEGLTLWYRYHQV